MQQKNAGPSVVEIFFVPVFRVELKMPTAYGSVTMTIT